MSKIVATGYYLPSTELDNNDLIERTGIDSSDEWIQQRTGIRSRHFADADESPGFMAYQAAKAALDQLDQDILQEIELILVATMTSSKLHTPSVASQVQALLGNEGAWCFDLNGACSGFVMAMEVAEKLTQSRTSGYSLVIGAEKMSDILNFEDRGSSILFGDGAGAVILKHDGQGLPNYRSQLGGMPDSQESIKVEVGPDNRSQLKMEGRGVYNFVLRQVIPALQTFTQDLDYDYLISHQANYRFLEVIAKKLDLEASQIPSNIDSVANTSAASIPILLAGMVEDGRIRLDGSQTIVMTGFGAGLAWGHISLTL